MSVLREMQQQFLSYLLEKPSLIIDSVVEDGKISAEHRLNFYANGYKLRLKEAIETDYEKLHAYLGDELFDQLMEQYIKNYPSHHPSLRYYSWAMPELLASTDQWKQTPELSELALIEKTLCDSFDSLDCNAVSIQELAQLARENWPTLKMKFHDSVEILDLNTNSFQIWKALAEDKIPPKVLVDPTHWLIWRSELISKYSALSAAEYCALQIMRSDGDFSALCEGLLDFYDAEETPQQAVALLKEWLSNNMVAQLVY